MDYLYRMYAVCVCILGSCVESYRLSMRFESKKALVL